MKKLLLIFLSLLLSAIVAQAQFFRGFSVESYQISLAWPTSFRSVRGNVKAVVSNTGDTRTLNGVQATIYRNGRRFALGTGEDVTFRQGRWEYLLKGLAKLADGVSTWDAIRAPFSFKASEYTLDFSVTITHADGTVDQVHRTSIPLTHYLRR